LPDFAHTQIPFSLIVGEGHVGFHQKAGLSITSLLPVDLIMRKPGIS
jgi:hypothetical protein